MPRLPARALNAALLGALLALLALAAAPLRAQGFDSAARAAWVYDHTTGTVLLAKNADEPLPPASMSKLMTIYMAFEAVEEGRLAMDATLPVSEHAMSYGGSSMFLNTLDRPTVGDLLRGVIVLSGNDATVVLAEALSPDGTEAGFAELMNRKAEELGMRNSHFENSNGWPAEGHVMSARDLGVLAEHLITDFPELYKIFAEQEFEFDGRVPSNSQNRNPILGLGIGADGLKTGHTQEAGYGLVGSAVQGDRRVTFVVMGLPSEEARRTEGERLLNWAFRTFEVREVGEAGERIGEAAVWMGAADRVGLALPEALAVLVPAHGGVEAEIVYEGPLSAPVEAGAEVAHLRLRREGLPDMDLPLVAEGAVARGGFGPRMRTTVGVLLARAGFGAGGPAPEPAGPEASSEGPGATDEAASVEASSEASPEAPEGDGGGAEPLADGG